MLDIVDDLRPQTCHFAPPVYNELLKRCWNKDPLKRLSIKEVLESIEFWCFHRKQVNTSTVREGNSLFRYAYDRRIPNDENDRFRKSGYTLSDWDARVMKQFANSQMPLALIL